MCKCKTTSIASVASATSVGSGARVHYESHGCRNESIDDVHANGNAAETILSAIGIAASTGVDDGDSAYEG